MLYKNVIKSYQVKDLGKKRVVGFDDDLDFIKSPDQKGTLKSEIQNYTEKLEELEKEFEERRNDLVLLNNEIEKKVKEAEIQKQEFIKQQNDEARIESQKIIEEARQKGLNEGNELGKKELIKSYEDFTVFIEKWMENLREEVKEYDKKYRSQVVNIMFSIISKVIHGEELSEVLKNNTIRNFDLVYREIEKNIKYCIYVNKSDYEIVESHIETLYEGYKVELVPEVFPSEKISSGGCIIETQFGTLDVSLESQLGEIYKEFIRLSNEDVSTLS